MKEKTHMNEQKIQQHAHGKKQINKKRLKKQILKKTYERKKPYERKKQLDTKKHMNENKKYINTNI